MVPSKYCEVQFFKELRCITWDWRWNFFGFLAGYHGCCIPVPLVIAGIWIRFLLLSGVFRCPPIIVSVMILVISVFVMILVISVFVMVQSGLWAVSLMTWCWSFCVFVMVARAGRWWGAGFGTVRVRSQGWGLPYWRVILWTGWLFLKRFIIDVVIWN